MRLVLLTGRRRGRGLGHRGSSTRGRDLKGRRKAGVRRGIHSDRSSSNDLRNNNGARGPRFSCGGQGRRRRCRRKRLRHVTIDPRIPTPADLPRGARAVEQGDAGGDDGTEVSYWW
jgi:hypothetical protein